MKLKKLAALLTAAAMTVGVMASCGSSGGNEDNSKAEDKTSSAAAESKTDSTEVPEHEDDDLA